jgi:hypothetical protein
MRIHVTLFFKKGKANHLTQYLLHDIIKSIKKHRKEVRLMYRNVIDIRKEVPNDVLKVLVAKADKAFNNRAGRVKNVSTSPYRFIYEGGEKEYGCLEVGMLNLKKESNFLPFVSAWQWIDDDPDECCDLLKLFTKKG